MVGYVFFGECWVVFDCWWWVGYFEYDFGELFDVDFVVWVDVDCFGFGRVFVCGEVGGDVVVDVVEGVCLIVVIVECDWVVL